MTNPRPAFYGVGGARISSQDGARCASMPAARSFWPSSVTEQGQGTEAMMAQIVATALGVPLERVRVITGDTENTPYGGGTWASRGAGIGGEAALAGGEGAARQHARRSPARCCKPTPQALDIRDGVVVDADSGARAHAARRGRRASAISAPTRCRPASRPS